MIGAALAAALLFSFIWLVVIRSRHFPLRIAGGSESHRCVEGSSTSLRLEIRNKHGASAPPVEVKGKLDWYERSITVSGAVRGSGTAEVSELKRGSYEVMAGTVGHNDPLKLAALFQRFELSVALRVIPSAPEVSTPLATRGTGGGEIRLDVPRDRNETLIEHRPYTPGDDARRIHWKMLAHTGELFLRRGEEIPPPSQVAYVIADTGIANSLDGLDAILRTAVGIAEDLLDRGLEVRIGTTAAGATFRLTPGDTTEEVRTAWAEQYLEAPGGAGRPDQLWPAGTILVSIQEREVEATVI